MRLQWQPFLIAACVTVLYDIFGPDTDPDYGKDIFGYVNQAIYCLDQVNMSALRPARLPVSML